MIEPIEDMPKGTVGFRATGHVTADDYREQVLSCRRCARPRRRGGAIVTDVEWIAKASHMFAWMVPGELMVRGLDGLEDAKAWLSS